MKTLSDVQAGDKLVMIYRTGRITNGKSDDRFAPAEVTEAKRINLTVVESDPDGRPARTWTIRRDTRTVARGRLASGSMYGWHGYTPEEHEYSQRMNAAYRFLNEQRIRVDFASPWHNADALVGLADAIRRHVHLMETWAEAIREDWARQQVTKAGESWQTHMAKFDGTVVPR